MAYCWPPPPSFAVAQTETAGLQVALPQQRPLALNDVLEGEISTITAFFPAVQLPPTYLGVIRPILLRLPCK